MKDAHICPVCGFDGLEDPPFAKGGEPSYEICPCCGFEFGFDEGSTADKYKSYCLKWIKDGAKWFSPDRKPKGWDLDRQLKNIN